MEGECQGWMMGALGGWWMPGRGGREPGDRHRQQTGTSGTSGSPPLQAEAVCQSWGWASPRVMCCPGILPSRHRRGRAGHRGSHNFVFLLSFSCWSPPTKPPLSCAGWARGTRPLRAVPLFLIPHWGRAAAAPAPGGPGELALETPHGRSPKWPKFPLLGEAVA